MMSHFYEFSKHYKAKDFRACANVTYDYLNQVFSPDRNVSVDWLSDLHMIMEDLDTHMFRIEDAHTYHSLCEQIFERLQREP